MSLQREFKQNSQSILVSVWRGVIVGILVGLVVSAFRWLLDKSFHVTVAIYHLARHDVRWLGFIIVASFILIFLSGILVKQEKDIKGSGIPHIEGELVGLVKTNWWSILWRKFVGGVMAISTGLLLGREGPSIQLGAMTAKGVSETLKLSKREGRILLASGASAGLSATFNAPVAGLLFVVEEVYHHFSRFVWITAFVASLVSNAVSMWVFGQTPVLQMPKNLGIFPLKYYWLLIILGIVMGLLGYFYEWVILRLDGWYQKVGGFLRLPSHLYGLIAVALLIPFGLIYPNLLGGGHSIVVGLPTAHLFFGLAIYYFILRFVGGMVSYGSGLPGGIFLPLLASGALAGYAYGRLVLDFGAADEALLVSFMIFGMTSYLGAVLKAPLTAMFLVTEMVGDLQQLMPLATTTLIAYLVMDLLGGEPVYEALLMKMVSLRPMKTGEPTMIDLPVTDKIAGKKVMDLDLPSDVLISTQIYQEQSEVVTGQTVLKAGAQIYLVVNESDISQVKECLLS